MRTKIQCARREHFGHDDRVRSLRKYLIFFIPQQHTDTHADLNGRLRPYIHINVGLGLLYIRTSRYAGFMGASGFVYEVLWVT